MLSVASDGWQASSQLAHALAAGQRQAHGLGRHRLGIGGVIGPHARQLRAGRRRPGRARPAPARTASMKLGNACAVVRQHPRTRRRLAHEDAGHGAEEVLADQLLHDREGVGQRVDQRTDDVVAVHGQARGRIGAVPGAQAGRTGRGPGPAARPRTRPGCQVAGLCAAASCASPVDCRSAAARRAPASRPRRAPASASRVASAGTSLSRSSSVGTAPGLVDARRRTGPDRLVHRAAVAVDQQRRAGGVVVAREAREMDLAHRVQRQFAQVGQRIAAMVGAGHVERC